MGFPKVRQPHPPTREMQWLDRLPSLRVTRKGEEGHPSTHFNDDPLVNSLAKLPSLEEAMSYMGSQPTFEGNQRPGDYQRVVQREMADKASGGMLPQMLENRTNAAKDRAGDFTPNEADVARAMGNGGSAFRGAPDEEDALAKMRLRYGL